MPAPEATQASEPLVKDILQVLLEGHERIRRFTALAVQLAHAQDVSPAELSETAARVLHYFTVELPQHLEEEEQCLVPRLFAEPLPVELVDQLWAMETQHDACEQLLARLVPLWTRVRDTPRRYPELAERLARESHQLMTAMEEHVTMEERILFPFVRTCFSQATLVRLAEENLLRRLNTWGEPLPRQDRTLDEAGPASPLNP